MKNVFTVKNLAGMGVFTALAFVAYCIIPEIPIFPGTPADFLKLDFSNVFIILAGFMYGPIPAIIITIVKEAINNILKHSNASNVDIIMQEHPAFYQLLIHDNGKCISKKVSEGIGLTNMRDRISALNGNIKITTDDGFKILISILKTGV